jgi:hypothetical protein
MAQSAAVVKFLRRQLGIHGRRFAFRKQLFNFILVVEDDTELHRLLAEHRSAVLLPGHDLAVNVYQTLPFRGDRVCAWVRTLPSAVGDFQGAKVSVNEVDDGGGGAAFAKNVVLLRVICTRASWYLHDRVVVGVGNSGCILTRRFFALLSLAGVADYGFPYPLPGLISPGVGG